MTVTKMKKLMIKNVRSRGKRKLTDAQVLEIVERYRAGGITQSKLGAEYGIKGPSVAAIMTGKSYAWLTRIGVEDPAPLARAA